MLSTSPDAWVWALWAWQELILSVPRWQLTEAGFALLDGDRVVGVVPLQWSGDKRRLSGTGFGLTSPAVIGGVSDEDRERYRLMIFDHIRSLADAGGAQRLEFALSPVSRAAVADPSSDNPFVRFGFDDESGWARVLNLRPDADALFAQCSKDTRQQIKRARAAGVTVRRADWIASLDDYYALHTETYARTGVPPHPREYFEGIARHLGPAGHSVLWGAYDASGRPIAFHNCARFGTGAMYHTGCSAGAALENGANYLVFWESILDAKATGALDYEIGEVFPGAEGKRSGLTTFKSKFGGTTRPVFRAGKSLIPVAASPAPQVSADEFAAGGVVTGVLRESLRATRRLSERLIGPTITNTAARAVVAGAKALRDGTTGRVVSESSPAAAVQPSLSTIRFFRPFWDDAEARAVRRPISAAERLQREQDLAAEIRRAEQFEEGAEVVLASSGRGAMLGALQIFSATQPSRRSVIIPSYSCKGLFDAVIRAGLVPRLVDIDADFNADPSAISDAIDDDSLAVVAVHLAGQRFAHEEILATARSKGVFIIEDKAHAFGSGWCLESDAVIYSFGLGKNVMATTGGAVVGRVHAREFARLRSAMSDEGADVAIARYDHVRHAFFSDDLGAGGYPAQLRPDYGLAKLNAVDAAILAQQLRKAPAIVARRRALAAVLVAELRAHPGIFHIQSGTGGHAYTKLMVDVRSRGARDRFLNFMAQHGIELEWMYVPLHTRECGRPYQTTPLPETDRLDGTVVNVPVRPDLSADEVQRIAAAIHGFAVSERRRD